MTVSHDKVEVKLPAGTYLIEIGNGLLDRIGDRIKSVSSAGRVILVTDENVAPLYANRASASLKAAGISGEVIVVAPGEGSKSLTEASRIFDQLAARQHDRDEPIVALGGGVVGDLAGFVASTWLRGVPFIQCPTTLEADVDASVGGKTAVNHPAGKNLIGAFHQPRLVLIDPACLETLPDRDFTAGLAESVKHAVILDPAFLTWHEERVGAIRSHDESTLRDLIRRNCEIKAQVVAADERERCDQGVGRAALNFGHTVGHAIEAEEAYSLRHGEAVSLGMVAALDLAVRETGFPDSDRQRIESLLDSLNLPIRIEHPVDLDSLLRRISGDKKARHERIRFVLPGRVGQMRWLESPSRPSIEQSIGRLQG